MDDKSPYLHPQYETLSHEELKKLQLKYHESMLKVLPASVVIKCLFYAEEFDRNKLREASQRHGGQRKEHAKRSNKERK